MRIQATVIAIIFAGALTNTNAQWLNYPDARIPRTKDGKPNLSAPAPRTKGKSDLSGLWQADRTSDREYNAVLGAGFSDFQPDLHDITKNVLNVFWGMKPEDEPLRPEAAAIVKQRKANPKEVPRAQCLPGSVPFGMLVFTFKIVQTPEEIFILTEINDPPRQIHKIGRA